MPGRRRAARVFAILIAMSMDITPVLAQNLEEKAQICSACHGENGVPQERTTPIIWGQHQGYTYIQLRDYKRGTRKDEQMTAIVADMDRNDMMALAEYFSKKPWPNLQQLRADEATTMRALRANVAVNCTGCHLGEYQGDGTVPRLAGQSAEYMSKTIAQFRTRERANNPGMSDLMIATSPDDLAALVAYLAGR
ncbi:c-type cytochrome [Microvirga massiliensis]|uniref:c-type cytochrome n=1 Tax=Microvirga massiliensis TaxID=1033741 RepID=UPI000ACD635D|nr:c-type cytochrome [Microvirga massiliensis]